MAHAVKGKTYMLPLYSESQGTLKLFSLLPLAIVALETGGVAVVDELDAKLHPQQMTDWRVPNAKVSEKTEEE